MLDLASHQIFCQYMPAEILPAIYGWPYITSHGWRLVWPVGDDLHGRKLVDFLIDVEDDR